MKRLLEEQREGFEFEASLLRAGSPGSAEPSVESRERALEAAMGALTAAGAAALAAHPAETAAAKAAAAITGAKPAAAASLGALGWKTWAVYAIVASAAVAGTSAVVLRATSAPMAAAPHATSPTALPASAAPAASSASSPSSMESSEAPPAPVDAPSAPSRPVLPSSPNTVLGPALSVTPPPALGAPPSRASEGTPAPRMAPNETPTTPAAEAEVVAPAASSPAAARGDLNGEVLSIEQARSALAANRPSDALRALDEYAQRHPHGSLGRESELLRIEALVMRGDRAEAQRRGHAMLTTSPDGLYRARLRKILGEEVVP
jgi:hypothetical protein